MGANVLIVDDDPVLCRSLRRTIRWRTRLRAVDAGTLRASLHIVERMRRELVGAVIDVRLPDGSGLDLVAELRSGGSEAPILVYTGLPSSQVSDACDKFSAVLAVKPHGEPAVHDFIEHVAVRSAIATSTDHSPRGQAVELFAARHRLSKRQQEILRCLAGGVRRADLGDTLGIEETTVKSHVRELLTRTGAESVDQLGWMLLDVIDEPTLR